MLAVLMFEIVVNYDISACEAWTFLFIKKAKKRFTKIMRNGQTVVRPFESRN